MMILWLSLGVGVGAAIMAYLSERRARAQVRRALDQIRRGGDVKGQWFYLDGPEALIDDEGLTIGRIERAHGYVAAAAPEGRHRWP